ncbi:hypothetical protein K4L44_07995 [Halosquirtibacter laminarini]|uniref:Uncharacterized protein n=1 Tax=Halosquirtibacter laminarini TaxID=3374600 RepID=A0AC61NJ49_9BACT|nr:hypothetical protein K4L44_07995 [Prolixibacteraceae bacterium]
MISFKTYHTEDKSSAIRSQIGVLLVLLCFMVSILTPLNQRYHETTFYCKKRQAWFIGEKASPNQDMQKTLCQTSFSMPGLIESTVKIQKSYPTITAPKYNQHSHEELEGYLNPLYTPPKYL